MPSLSSSSSVSVEPRSISTLLKSMASVSSVRKEEERNVSVITTTGH